MNKREVNSSQENEPYKASPIPVFVVITTFQAFFMTRMRRNKANDDNFEDSLEDAAQDGPQNIYGKIVKFFAILIIAVICFIGTNFSLLGAVMIVNQDLGLAPEHDPKILSLSLLTIALVCSTLGLVLPRFVRMLIPNG